MCFLGSWLKVGFLFLYVDVCEENDTVFAQQWKHFYTNWKDVKVLLLVWKTEKIRLKKQSQCYTVDGKYTACIIYETF